MRRIFLPLWLPPTFYFVLQMARWRGFVFVNPDAATYLDFNLLIHTQRLPLFPLLVQALSDWGIEKLFAGQFIAALSGALTLGVLAQCGKRLGLDRSTAWYATATLAANPIFYLYGVQAMTETTFLFLAALTFLCFLRFLSSGRDFDLFWLIFVAGLSAATRAEGFVFLPPVIWCVWRFIRREKQLLGLLLASAGFASWSLVFFWYLLIVRQTGYFGEYFSHLAHPEWWNVLKHLVAYPLAVGANSYGFGLAFVWKGRREWRRNAGSSGAESFFWLHYLFIASWLGLAAHWYFDWRLTLILSLWISLPAALGMQAWRNGSDRARRLTQAAVALMLLGGVLVGQLLIDRMKDLGGDIRQAVAVAARQAPTLTVLADELAMTSYHLGRPVRPYDPATKLSRALVILSSRQSDLAAEQERLGQTRTIISLGDFRAMGPGGERRTVVWLISRRPETTATVPPTAGATGPGD